MRLVESAVATIEDIDLRIRELRVAEGIDFPVLMTHELSPGCCQPYIIITIRRTPTSEERDAQSIRSERLVTY